MALPIPSPASARPPSRGGTSSSHGFTLIEVLIYSVLSILVISSSAVLLISNLRGNIATERNQSLIDTWGRLSSFLESELNEGSSIDLGASVDCDGVAATSLFRINLPNTSVIAADRGLSAIDYYISTTGGNPELRRCGPPILPNGKLDFTSLTPVDSLVSSDTSMTISSDATASIPGSFLNYTVSLTDQQGNVIYTRSATATTRTSPIN